MGKEINLLPHNIPVYDKFEKALEKNDKVLLCTATGTGKSFICAKYLKDHNKKALIVCPKTAINRIWEERGIKREDIISYQKLSMIDRKLLDDMDYDTFVFDEAHHCGGDTWKNPILYLMNKKGVKFIGLTADPIRHTDGGKNVSDEYFDSNVISGYSLLEAIEEDILPEFSYISTVYNIGDEVKRIKNRAADFVKADNKIAEAIKKLVFSTENIYQIDAILKKHMPKGNRKGIVFIESVDKLREGKNLINRVYKDETIYILYSYLSSTEKEKIINAFQEAEHGFLICVDMLNEGLHFKNVNTIIMLRHTCSPNVFYQQLGRGLAYGNKNVIVFDFVGNHKSLKMAIPEMNIFLDEYKKCLKKKKKENQVIIRDYARQGTLQLAKIEDMLSGAVWKPEEDDILRKYYKEEGSECCKRLHGRTRSATRVRASVLNLATNTNWSKDEVKTLEEYYPTEGGRIVKRLPGRTRKSCISKATALGIRFISDGWSEEEDNIIRENYPLYGTAKTQLLLPNKTKTAVKSHAFALGIQKRDWTDDEIEVLMKYYPDEGRNVSKRLFRWSSTCCSNKAKELGIRSKRAWTKEEVDYLVEHYPKEGESCFKFIKNKSNRSCKTKVLNLKKAGVFSYEKRVKPWSDEELLVLKKYHNQEITKEEVLNLMPERSWSSCNNKLTREFC